MPSNELFMTNNLFIFPITVHGKDLAEEIKSETSGDLQSTLTKLVEVRCVLLYTKIYQTCWFHLFNVCPFILNFLYNSVPYFTIGVQFSSSPFHCFLLLLRAFCSRSQTKKTLKRTQLS